MRIESELTAGGIRATGYGATVASANTLSAGVRVLRGGALAAIRSAAVACGRKAADASEEMAETSASADLNTSAAACQVDCDGSDSLQRLVCTEGLIRV